MKCNGGIAVTLPAGSNPFLLKVCFYQGAINKPCFHALTTVYCIYIYIYMYVYLYKKVSIQSLLGEQNIE